MGQRDILNTMLADKRTSRREFLVGATALGLSAATASSLPRLRLETITSAPPAAAAPATALPITEPPPSTTTAAPCRSSIGPTITESLCAMGG